MAVTILQEPAQYTPVYNDLNFLCSSTNVAQPNFNYIFDVKINGSTVSRHRIPKNVNNNYGLFNAKRIAENYLTQVFAYNFLAVTPWSSGILSLQVEVREEYGSTPTISSLQATSSLAYAWIAALDAPEWVDYTVSKYRILSTETDISQLLSNNLNQNIKLTEKAWVYGLAGDNDAISSFRVQAYNAAGTQIQNTYILNPNAIITAVGHRMVSCPAGPQNLNSILNAQLSLTTQNEGNIIPSTTAYYKISTRGASGTSKVQQFNIVETCTKYESYRIHFLNKLGGYDSFTFDLLSRDNNTIERKKYRRNLGAYSGATYVYNDLQRSNIIYDTQVNETMVLNSNWITDAEAVWLEELLSSPITYMESANGIEVINITDSAYEVKKRVNDKLFNLQINIEKTYIKTRQRG
jgi:hypothetical protein